MTLRDTRRLFGSLFACCALLSAFREDPVPATSAFYSARLTGSSQSFTGATFIPSVAPVVSATQSATRVALSWPRVSMSGTADVGYRVMRSASAGTVEVCKGANAPVVTGDTVVCFDDSVNADISYTYTQQPVLVRDATVTWSLSPSASSAPLVGPRIAFASVGATVSTTGPSVSVPVPVGTQPGDVLLLVSVSGRQNAPTTPVGWTLLASVGLSGGSALRLFVAWRIADTTQSVSWDPNANSTGASVRLVRYARGTGNASTPVVAVSQVATATGGSSATFLPSPNPTTTGANSEVVNIVVQRKAGVVSLATSAGFTLDHSEIATFGGVPQAVGIGGRQVITAESVPLPAWASTDTGVWAAVTAAFR
ncbi:MAG: hypothetical protein EBV24_04795 [Actinobacteria bacterium]|nr:hypothetical protein [Actinomycetota bacterium]